MNKITQNFYPLAIFSILILSGIFIPDSFAVSDLSIKIPRDNFMLGDSVYISGTLIAPTSDTLTLKIYDSHAKLILINKIPISVNDNEFNHTLFLSGSDWIKSGLYIILAEIDDVIVSTKFTFDLKQDSPSIQNHNVTVKEHETLQIVDSDKLAQQIAEQLALQPKLDSDKLAQQIAEQLALQPKLDSDKLAQQIAEQLTLQPKLDSDKLAQQIAEQLALQPKLDSDKLAQQIAEQLTSQQLSLQQDTVASSSSSLSKIDSDKLAQQIAEQLTLQPKLDSDKLAQQIAEQLTLQQLSLQQDTVASSSSSLSKIDSDKLAQQIAEQLTLQPKLDSDKLAQQIAEQLTLQQLSLQQDTVASSSSLSKIDSDKLAQQIAEQLTLQPKLDSDKLAQQIAEQLTLQQLSLQQDTVASSSSLSKIDSDKLAQQITAKKLTAQQKIDDLTIRETNIQQKIDDLTLSQSSLNSTHLQLNPTLQSIQNQNKLDDLIFQLDIQEDIIDNLKRDKSQAEQMNGYAIAQQIAAKILSEEQILKKLELDIYDVERSITLSNNAEYESVTSQLIDAQQIADRISIEKKNTQKILHDLDLITTQQQIQQPTFIQKSSPNTDVDLKSFIDEMFVNYTLLLVTVVIASFAMMLLLYLKLPVKSKNSPSLLSAIAPHSSSELVIIKEPVAASVTLENNIQLSYDKWKNMDQPHEVSSIDFWIPIINNGNASVTSVAIGFIQSEHELTTQDLDKITPTAISNISANDYCYYPFSINCEDITQLNTTPVFVGICLCYDVDINSNIDKQRIEVIYKIDNNITCTWKNRSNN